MAEEKDSPQPEEEVDTGGEDEDIWDSAPEVEDEDDPPVEAEAEAEEEGEEEETPASHPRLTGFPCWPRRGTRVRS